MDFSSKFQFAVLERASNLRGNSHPDMRSSDPTALIDVARELVEKGDFGEATIQNSGRYLHSKIRAEAQLEVRRIVNQVIQNRSLG